jgi:hypothetical protein
VNLGSDGNAILLPMDILLDPRDPNTWSIYYAQMDYDADFIPSRTTSDLRAEKSKGDASSSQQPMGESLQGPGASYDMVYE